MYNSNLDLHGATSQKTAFFIVIAVKTSDLTTPTYIVGLKKKAVNTVCTPSEILTEYFANSRMSRSSTGMGVHNYSLVLRILISRHGQLLNPHAEGLPSCCS
jgi:hypothetical protein